MKRRGGWSRVMDGEEVTVTVINARSQTPSRCDVEGLGFYGDFWKPLEVRAGWCLLIRCPPFSRVHSICCVASKSTADKRRRRQAH